MEGEQARADVLFEVSWEVCNRVGGIHTVIATKVDETLAHYGEYIAVGPYIPEQAQVEFEESSAPEELRLLFESLMDEGIVCHYGRWLTGNRPQAILVDFKGYYGNVNGLKANLWERYGIDSLGSAHDFDEPVVWSHAVGRLVEEYARKQQGKKIVLHAHEWMAGPTILHLQHAYPHVGTVFTTHATMLGRTLASNGVDIYSEQLDGHELAYQYGVHPKHQTEQATAHTADVFTTVSSVTAWETEALLGVRPDKVLVNGLDISEFPTFEESSVRHRLFRDKIREFLMAYFFPYYTFDLKQSLTFFTCGRPEFHVKGTDQLIESLGELNQRLTHQDKTVVMFIFMPGDVSHIKQEIVENNTYVTDLKDELMDSLPDVRTNLLSSLLKGEQISEENIFSRDTLEQMEKTRRRMQRRNHLPPVCTHELRDEEHNPVIQKLHEVGLHNKPQDKVKVIYYPIYLTGADGLLNLDYYEAISGGHLGIFPSFYEPWGYTPHECAALGVPAVTSDLTGFGRYILERRGSGPQKGIFVVPRKEKGWEESRDSMTEILHWYARLSRSFRIDHKIHAKSKADQISWAQLFGDYIAVHNQAIKRSGR